MDSSKNVTFSLYQDYVFEERDESFPYGVSIEYNSNGNDEEKRIVQYFQSRLYGVVEDWDCYQKSYEMWNDSEGKGEKLYAKMIKKEEKLMRKMIGRWIDITSKPPHGKLFLLDLRRAQGDEFLHE